MTSGPRTHSPVDRYDEELLTLVGSHSSKLMGLLDNYESLRARSLLGVAAIAALLVITSTAMIVLRVDLLFANPNSGSAISLASFMTGGLLGVLSAVALVYSQFRQRWILVLQIRVTTSALDQIITHATRLSASGKYRRNSTSSVLWSVQIAEAKAILQHARYIGGRIARFDEEDGTLRTHYGPAPQSHPSE